MLTAPLRAPGPDKDSTHPRVLLLAPRLWLRGTSVYSRRLAELLPGQAIDSLLICPDASLLEPSVRQQLRIREYSYLLTPGISWIVHRLLLRALWSEPPDLIHAQSRRTSRSAAWIAQRLQRPYVLTVHDLLPDQHSLWYDRRWCHRIIAVSEAVMDELVHRHHVPASLVTIIHSGVEVPEREQTPSVLPPDKIPVIGTAGPLEAVKGFPFFLGAAARVLAAGWDVEFVIAGSGPEEYNLRRLARELNIADRVTFIPNLSDFEMALQAMDIFCLPSLQQGLGTILLEAMALGRPVIGTRVGGVYKIIREGETGLLVPPSDSHELAEAILKLLSQPSWARVLGAAAQQEVRAEFNVTEMLHRTVAVYRDVLQAASQNRQQRNAIKV